jgi:hypothetical protein
MLLMIEGFESFGTSGNVSTALARKYSLAYTTSVYNNVATGRIAGYCLQNPGRMTFTTGTSLSTTKLVMGMGMKIPAERPDGNFTLFSFITGGYQFNLRVVLSGGLASFQAYYYGAYAQTSAIYSTGKWYYIEFSWLPSTGACEIRVNGSSVATGKFVVASPITSAQWNYTAASLYNGVNVGVLIDDIYLCDSLGTTNNSFLGCCQVKIARPNADGANSQWTPNCGTSHYSRVNSNDTTSYLGSRDSGTLDTFGYEDITGTVLGVQINTSFAAKSGTPTLYTPVISSGVQSDGEATTATTSYKVKTRIVETDPATGSLWTADGLNAAEFGIKQG